jgi:hypothetical protein
VRQRSRQSTYRRRTGREVAAGAGRRGGCPSEMIIVMGSGRS